MFGRFELLIYFCALYLYLIFEIECPKLNWGDKISNWGNGKCPTSCPKSTLYFSSFTIFCLILLYLKQ